MKSLIQVLILITFSIGAFAQDLGWNCMVSPKDMSRVDSLKLPGYLSMIGILTISPENCSQVETSVSSDTCIIDGHKVVVGLDPLKSELLTKGEEVIPLMCEENLEHSTW